MNNLYQNRSLRTYSSEVFILLVSAFIYSIAFPGFVSSQGLGFIAFFALIPVFAVIRNTNYKAVGLYGFIFGVVFYTIFNYWLATFHELAIVIVTIIKGSEMFMLFYALKAADSLFKKYGYLLQGIIWIAYAYLSESWFAGYPYGTISYALYEYLPLLQIAEYTGIWAIIFMMIIPQTFIAKYFADIFKGGDSNFLNYIKENLIFSILYPVLFILWLVIGLFQLGHWANNEADYTWRVAAIQHNADTWEGGYDTYKRNFNNLRRLSLEALEEDPEIIIWSETAFVPSVYWHTTYSYGDSEKFYGNSQTQELVEEFVNFGLELDVPLLTGNPKGVLEDINLPPMNGETGELNRKDYNSVLLFDDGKIKTEYTKQHLVPFTEHFPYEKQLPWLYNILLSHDYNWWEKGEESVVFNVDETTFSTPICYEDSFGYLSSDFVRNGANVIVNMTNDRWSGSEDAALQHGAIAVLRAIETRKTMVRSTNSGFTCMILPTGEIVDSVKQFKMTYKIYDVPVYTSETYGFTTFVKYTDYLAYASIILSGLALVVGIIIKLVKKYEKK